MPRFWDANIPILLLCIKKVRERERKKKGLIVGVAYFSSMSLIQIAVVPGP